MSKVAPSKVPPSGERSGLQGMFAEAKTRLTPLGSKRRLKLGGTEADAPNALDTTPLGSPGSADKLTSDARARAGADGPGGSGGADVTNAGEVSRTDMNSSSGDSSSEGQQLASLQDLLARGEITPDQFRTAVVAIAADRSDEPKSSTDGTFSETEESIEDSSKASGSGMSAARRFDISRPWLLKSFIMPDEKRNIDAVLRATGTDDAYQALRYIRAHPTVAAAVAALHESLIWRKEVMVPLLQNPGEIIDELMTERIWLLPRASRENNPVIFFNSARAKNVPDDATIRRMVLSTLYVVEKALKCCEDPMAQVEFVLNRSKEYSGDLPEDKELSKAELKLYRMRLRQRLRLLMILVTKHYPGRIRMAYMAGVDMTRPVVLLTVSFMQHLIARYNFPVEAVSIAQLGDRVGSQNLPKSIGGDLSYNFVLSDVMMPSLHIPFYSKSALRLRFDDTELERQYRRATHRQNRGLRGAMSVAAAVTAVLVAGYTPDTDADAACGMPVSGAAWYYIAAWVVVLAVGLLAVFYAGDISKHITTWYAFAFAVLVQSPSIHRGIQSAGWRSDDPCHALRATTGRPLETAIFGAAIFMIPATLQLQPRPNFYALLTAWITWIIPTCVESSKGVPTTWTPHILGLIPMLIVATGLGLHDALTRARYRKQIGAEQSLRAVQAELSSLRSQIRNAPVLALDTNLNIVIWSPSMQNITGWRSSRVVGQPFVNFVAASDRDRVGERLAVALKQSASASTMIEVPVVTFGSKSQKSSSSSASSASQSSASMLTAEAENVTLLCNVAQRSDTNAKVSGLTVLAQDISERVRLETARKRFIASFSHELRTPLSGIMGMLDLLDLQPVGGPAHKLIHKAQISSNLLLNLVNDILDMSRIEAGNMELENRPFSVQRVVAHSLDLVRYQAEMKKLKISHEIDDGVPEEVSGDVTRFRQVLLNLLSNAVKFTMEGEVRVIVSADFAERGGGVKLRVAVRDSGVGISESNLPRLFHMFSKVGMDNDMVNNASGCGLGLAISSRLVHLMGGEIRVSSKFGRGSTFTYTVLKRFVEVSPSSAGGSIKGSVGSGASDSRMDSKQKRERVNAAVRGKRVLLAEDNAFNAEIITSHLESAGVVVHWASNGRNALDDFKNAHSDERPYQAVIMDCQMPVMTGWDATKVIREWEMEQQKGKISKEVGDANTETYHDDSETIANVPIIALTAYASETEKTKCIDSGMNVVITKPVQRSLLLRCLASFFDAAVSDTASNTSSKHREYPDDQVAIDEDAAEQHDSYGHRSNPNALTASLTASMLQRETQDRSSTHTNSSEHNRSGSRGSSEKGSRTHLSALSFPTSTGSTMASSTDPTRDSWGGAAAGSALSASCQPIDEALGMSQFGSSTRVYYKMMSKFATEYLPTGYSAICAAAKANDNIALRMEAHSLKGAAAFVGASALSDTCERLMSVCGLEGEVAPWQQRFITQLVSQLQAEYELLNVYFESKHNYTLMPSESLGADSVGEVVGLFAQDKAKCQGCHALFAEDNRFTVEVLKCLVANVGMTAKWVTDGSAVVKEYTKSPSTFQLIIMDCQMPKQSGPEAARQIREWEQSQDTTPKMHVPIVGLSAYELHRKECVDAGMDRFVVKPIGRAALIHLIADCVKDKNMTLQPNDSVTLRPGEVPGSKVLFSPVDEGQARDLFDSPSDFASKLQLFVETELRRAERITDMLKVADWKQMHLEAHALKGSAASVCASGLAQACSRLQSATHDDGTLHNDVSADAVANLVSLLNIEVDQLRAYQHRQSKGAATGAAASDAACATTSISDANDSDRVGGMASEVSTSQISVATAPAEVITKHDSAPPASKALRLYTARDMVAWAREILQMPEHVCNALHDANVDGEDVCSFSDEEWNILSKEHGLSSLIVRKLRRKCTLAAEIEVEQGVDDV